MKEFAGAFYASTEWKKCRQAYKKSVGGLCEVCLKQGIITPAEIVHHKIELTPDNINDPSVSLSFENLQAVCREHHAELHGARQKRYKIDDMGHIICE